MASFFLQMQYITVYYQFNWYFGFESIKKKETKLEIFLKINFYITCILNTNEKKKKKNQRQMKI